MAAMITGLERQQAALCAFSPCCLGSRGLWSRRLAVAASCLRVLDNSGSTFAQLLAIFSCHRDNY